MSKEKKPRKFRPVRFIFKLIGILVAIIILIPVVLLLLMFDWSNYQPPVADFEAQTTFVLTDFVADRVSAFIDATDMTAPIDISISTPEINAALINMFRDRFNENYLVEGADDNQFFLQESIVGFKGVTATISDDAIRIDAGATAQLLSWLNFRVRLRVDVGFVEDTDGIKLQIQRLNISNLPLRSMYGIATTVTGWFGLDLPGLLDGLIPIGDFDSTNLAWSITYPELFDLIPDSGDSDMINLLAQLATQTFGPDNQRLFDISFLTSTDENVRGMASIKLNMGLFRTDEPSYTPLHNITSDDELEALFQGQISNMLISSLTSDAGTLNLDLSQEVLNEIIRYKMGQLIPDFNLNLGERSFVITSEPVFLTLLDNDKVEINMFLAMYENTQNADGTTTRSTSSFRTKFQLGADIGLAPNGEDLMFIINSIAIGDFALTQDMIIQLVTIVNNDMLTLDDNNQARLIISGFSNEILQAGVTIDDVHSLAGIIRFVITPTDQELANTVKQVQEAMNDALTAVQDHPDLDGEQFDDVKGAINDFVTSAQDPTTPPPSTDDVIDAVNNLSPEDQQTLFNSLTDSLTTANPDIDLNSLIPGLSSGNLPSNLPSLP